MDQEQKDKAAREKLAASKGLAELPEFAVSLCVFRMHAERHDPTVEVLLGRPKWMRYYGLWLLPETRLVPGEALARASSRLLNALMSVREPRPEVVVTIPRSKLLPGATTVCFSTVTRSAHPKHDHENDEVFWCDVRRLGSSLPEDYQDAVASSLTMLATSPMHVAVLVQNPDLKVAELVDGLNFLRSLAGVPGQIDKRNFRRDLELADWLEDTGRMTRGEANRPSKLYRVRTR